MDQCAMNFFSSHQCTIHTLKQYNSVYNTYFFPKTKAWKCTVFLWLANLTQIWWDLNLLLWPSLQDILRWTLDFSLTLHHKSPDFPSEKPNIVLEQAFDQFFISLCSSLDWFFAKAQQLPRVQWKGCFCHWCSPANMLHRVTLQLIQADVKSLFDTRPLNTIRTQRSGL